MVGLLGWRGVLASCVAGVVACSASGSGLGGDYDAGDVGAGGSAAASGGPPAGGAPAGGSGGAAGKGVGSTTSTGGAPSGGSAGNGPQSDAGVDSGLLDSSVGGAGGSDAGTAYGSCCTAATTPGCSEKAVEQCVCQIDPTCCAISWNASCVLEAFTYNCAACPDGGVTTGAGGTSGGPGGDCCIAHSTPGCGNASIQACVCGMDSYCCQYEWDSLCASEASSCGTC